VKTLIIVVAILVILLVIALVVLAGRRNARRARLRERFGPEYDLAVKRGKDRRAVEQRLEALAQRRDTLDIREVAPAEHSRFGDEWNGAQSRFVDDPGQSVADADGIVNSVLRSRGYPVESFDDRAALVATDHQDVVEGYRRAHDTYAAHLQGGTGDTEDLRQAFLSYRDVFERLNQPASGSDEPAALEGSRTRELEGAPTPDAEGDRAREVEGAATPDADATPPPEVEAARPARPPVMSPAAEPPARDEPVRDEPVREEPMTREEPVRREEQVTREEPVTREEEPAAVRLDAAQDVPDSEHGRHSAPRPVDGA
jgi:hypothetical protein